MAADTLPPKCMVKKINHLKSKHPDMDLREILDLAFNGNDVLNLDFEHDYPVEGYTKKDGTKVQAHERGETTLVSLQGHKNIPMTPKQLEKYDDKTGWGSESVFLNKYYYGQADKKWNKKSEEERTFGKTEYLAPSKEINGKIYQLGAIISYNLDNPEVGYDDETAMYEDTKERYWDKKEQGAINGYRIIRKKGRLEVWVDYIYDFIPDFIQDIFKGVEDLRVDVPGYEYTNKNGKTVKVPGYSYERGPGGKRIKKQPLKGKKKEPTKTSGTGTVVEVPGYSYINKNGTTVNVPGYSYIRGQGGKKIKLPAEPIVPDEPEELKSAMRDDIEAYFKKVSDRGNFDYSTIKGITRDAGFPPSLEAEVEIELDKMLTEGLLESIIGRNGKKKYRVYMPRQAKLDTIMEYLKEKREESSTLDKRLTTVYILKGLVPLKDDLELFSLMEELEATGKVKRTGGTSYMSRWYLRGESKYAPYELDSQATYGFDTKIDKKIYISKDLSRSMTTQFRVDKINRTFKKLPKLVRDSVKALRVFKDVGRSGYQKAGVSGYYRISASKATVGLHTIGKDKMYSTAWVKEVTIHECAHGLHHNTLSIDDIEKINSMYRRDVNKLTANNMYAGHTTDEYFAEGYTNMYLGNDKWFDILPNDVRTYFKNIVKTYDFIMDLLIDLQYFIKDTSNINGIKFSYLDGDTHVFGILRIPEDISQEEAIIMIDDGKAQFENVDKYFSEENEESKENIDFTQPQQLLSILHEIANQFDMVTDAATPEELHGTAVPRIPSAIPSGLTRLQQKANELRNLERNVRASTRTFPFRMRNSQTGATVRGQVVERLDRNTKQLTPLSSSNAKAAGQFGNELLVQFHPSGLTPQRTYRYTFDNPMNAEEAYLSITHSGSPGRWVWQNLRGHVAGEQVTRSKLAPSLSPPGKGLPTIGGTTASLVPYSISNRTPVSRVKRFEEMAKQLRRTTSNPVSDPQTGSRVENLLDAKRGLRDVGIRRTNLLGKMPDTTKLDFTIKKFEGITKNA